MVYEESNRAFHAGAPKRSIHIEMLLDPFLAIEVTQNSQEGRCPERQPKQLAWHQRDKRYPTAPVFITPCFR